MTFSDLNLSSALLNALNDKGLETPTTIQQKAYSVIMSGVDVCGIAQTGTGKTLAYLLPIIRLWKYNKDKLPQILILVPTRELVVQVVDEIKSISSYLSLDAVGVYGGANINIQKQEVAKGLDIIVGTPGRIYDLISHGTLKTKTIKTLVIDEVDEMLNLGMRSQIKRILDELTDKRQNLLFSATITPDVEVLMETYFKTPLKIEAAPTGTPLENINQMAYLVPNYNTKVNLLRILLANKEEFHKVLVFVASKKLADFLAAEIVEEFAETFAVIHSNKEQNHRFNTVNQFKNGNYRFIIATDIVARGIDVAEVSHVINFDLPEVPENYIHRIGRTGRADKKGIAISFITPLQSAEQQAIEQLMQYAIPMQALPADLEINTTLQPFEIPKIIPKEINAKLPKKEKSGDSFHEKSAKNSKVNAKRVSHKEAMLKKYGKPKKRVPKKK